MAADALELNLNIQKSLEKDLAESNKHLIKLNKSTDKLVDSYGDINKEINKQNTLLKAVGETTKKLAVAFVSGFTAINLADIVQDTMAIDTHMKRLAARTSEGVKGFASLKSTVYDVAFETGVAADKVMTLVENLKDFKISNSDVKNLAASVSNFSEATEMSVSETSQLVGNLVRFGKVGVENAKSVLVSMAQAQRTFNLTEGELSAISDSLQLNTKRMQQFGKTQIEIKRMQEGVIKLSGALSHVGIEASRANDIINGLLDPSRIEDNALMYAKLGVSITDVMDGSVNVAELGPKFKQLGQEIKGGGMAGVALAKQLGLTVEEAKQLADIDMNKFNTALKDSGGNASAALKQMNKEGMGTGEKIQKNWERIKTSLMGVLDKLLPIVEALTDKFTELIMKAIPAIKKFFENFKLDSLIDFIAGGIRKMSLMLIAAIVGGFVLFSKMMGRKAYYTGVTDNVREAFAVGTREGIMMGVKRSELKKQLTTSSGGSSEDKARRIQMSAGYQRRQATADTLEAMSQTELLKPIEKMVKGTAEWNRELAMSSRPVSRLVTMTEKLNKDIEDSSARSIISAKTQKQIFEEQSNALLDRKNQIQKYMEEEKRISGDGTFTYKKMEKAVADVEKQIGKNGITQEEIQEQIKKRTDRYYDNLSKQERGIAIERLKGMIEQRKADDIKIKDELESNKLQLELLELESKAVQREFDMLSLKKEEGTMTTEEVRKYKELIDRNKEIEKLTKDINNETEQYNDELTKSQKELEDINEELTHAQGKAIKASIPHDLTSFPEKIEQGIFAFGRGIKKGVEKFGEDVNDSARAFKMAVGSALDPRNIGTALKGMAGGVTKMLLGGLGIGSLINIFMNNEKVQKALNRVMGKLTPVVELVAEALVPIIEALVPLVESLLPPALKLLGGLLKALLWLLKPIQWLANKFTGSEENIISTTFNSLDKLADNLMKMNLNTTKAIEENTDANAEIAKSLEEKDSEGRDQFAVGYGGSYKKIEPPKFNSNKPVEVSVIEDKSEVAKRQAEASEVAAATALEAARKQAAARNTNFTPQINASHTAGQVG